MSQASAPRRRIVVTLDSAQVDQADLERLTRLARRLDADLEAVFIEDSDLLRLARLSFLREFRPASQRADSFQSERMQQELRVMARRAERMLAEYAEHRGVRWQFRTWRGSIEREFLAGFEADILALLRLGAVGWQPPRRRVRETVSVCFDGSEQGARALATAADLAADNDDISLQVLLARAPDSGDGEIRRQAEAILSGRAGRVTYVPLEDDTVGTLLEALHASRSTALVMQRDNALLRNTSLRQYLSRLHCPLFLVR